ncbi:Major facilitator superfamily domain-containing protein isoform 1 [Schistosoma japonicum]|uniref:Major facilitator superfamily domain-containing protein isoform 1 n=2 Tax=Schistosoma japonicum TaxID=6182 RepID=A0A4Z2DCM5_SCHJA|nr:Solute carrier family 49 member A3 [Schistosoma japonicum]KAH8868497.1 Solute carrier family 49 member A3 [Schistosoma japonicum]TNN14253.1 Major facilitator superfamily domain-containing protein isoform 1 [Schistosoma japonicum]
MAHILSNSQEDLEENSLITAKDTNYRVYKTRWIIVFTFASLSCTNAFIWISYSPVANYFVEFYSTSNTVLNLISLIYPLATIILGFPTAYSIDRLGVRFIVLCTAICNLMCGCLRVLSSAPYINISPSWRLTLIVLGQIIASFAQPFCLFCTTSLACDWFPDNQRTTANTIASLGNAVGILFGNAFAPNYIKKSADIINFNYISLGLVVSQFFLSFVLVRRSKPLTPPSHVAAVSIINRQVNANKRFLSLHCLSIFLKSFIPPLRLYGFWIITFTFGSSTGYFTILLALMQQILCTKGYSNQFAGFCGSITIAAGLIAAGPVALLVDKTGLLTETLKVTFSLSVLGCICLSIVLWFPNQQVLVTICLICLGAFGFSQYSLCLELAAEATYPVSETITTSFLFISTQIISLVMLPILQFTAPLAKNSTYITNTCGPNEDVRDFNMPHMGLCVFMVLLAIVQLFTLKLPYKRREYLNTIVISIESDNSVNDENDGMEQNDL